MSVATKLIPRLFATLRLGRLIELQPLERLYLAAYFAYKRYAEDPFRNVAKAYPALFRGGHILDVGANVGYTALVFARAAESPFRVYAFEPEPTNLRRLRVTIDRFGLGGTVIPVASAVGDEVGEVDLTINASHPGDHHVSVAGEGDHHHVRVPITTIDAFADTRELRPVKFVKIDVQGYELAVSRGMTRLIESSPRLAVALEYSEHVAPSYGYEATDLIRFYESRGFTIRLLTRRALAAVTSQTLADATAQRGYADLLAVKDVTDIAG